MQKRPETGLPRPARRLPGKAPRFAVSSWDDRLNVVAGLSFAERRRLVFGLVSAVQDRRLPSHQGDDLATWAALEILLQLIEAKRLRWGLGRHGGRGQTLLSMLPATLNPANVDDVPRRVRKLHADLRERLFEHVFVPNAVLQDRALAALVPGPGHAERLRLLASNHALLLPGGGAYKHAGLRTVMDYYGLGEAAWRERQRGYLVHVANVVALARVMEREDTLDLRRLSWRRGGFEPTA